MRSKSTKPAPGLLGVVALVLGLASLVLAGCGYDGIERYNATTFFQTTTYAIAASSGFPFSPDGESLLITSDESGVFNAYAQPITGGEAEALTSSTTNAIMALSYFPNDARIMYTFDEGGNELFQMYIREEDGTSQNLTPGEGVRAGFVGWHEDGALFWLLTNERDERFFDIYQYSISDDYERKMVFQNNLGLGVSAISPDGHWVALIKPRNSADSDIYLVDLQSEDQAPVLITEHEGNINYGIHGFTRDSAALIYSTNEFGEFQQAWTYDMMSEEKAVLIEADWDVSFVIQSPSGRFRVTGVNADAQTEVTVMDTLEDKPLILPRLPSGELVQGGFSKDEKTIVVVINSDTSPSNVFLVFADSMDLLQLTNALNPDMCQEDLVEAEVVRYKSFDNLEIPSILYKPKSASERKKVPALVYVHGGPGGQSRKGYAASFQHLVNHDFAILAANNRGSSGYGKTFFHMDDRRHGEVDLQDIVHGKIYLEGLDWVDPDRIGIIGASYGGYMVVAALAFEPDVFKVGIDIFGITNWLRTLKSFPPYWEAAKEALYDELGDPATDEERLRRISPIFHADKIKKPLLVVQGANDPRALQVESDDIVAALKKNGVPVEYLIFEDEGHGFLKRSNRVMASDAYLSFLNKYLIENQIEVKSSARISSAHASFAVMFSFAVVRHLVAFDM